MRIDELASEWEVEEMRLELASGDAPAIVAYRHRMPKSAVMELDSVVNRWSDAEEAFVRDNYPNHGADWDGWEVLGKTYEQVERHAIRRGLRKRKRRWADDEDDLLRSHYPTNGPRWDGWKRLLWWRETTPDTIAHRASTLGLSYAGTRNEDW